MLLKSNEKLCLISNAPNCLLLGKYEQKNEKCEHGGGRNKKKKKPGIASIDFFQVHLSKRRARARMLHLLAGRYRVTRAER